MNDSDSNPNTDTPRTGWTGFRLPFLPSLFLPSLPIFLPFGHVTGQSERLLKLTSSPKLVPAAVRESFRAAGPERILSDESETTLSGSDHSEVASC